MARKINVTLSVEPTTGGLTPYKCILAHVVGQLCVDVADVMSNDTHPIGTVKVTDRLPSRLIAS